jgi:glycosyltransferase involved in cell wall biosynthesis
MRIALYHNLPPGGALRCLREMVSRSSGVHQYDQFRIIDSTESSDQPERFSSAVASVHDIEVQQPLKRLSERAWPIDLATKLRTLWAAESAVARRIDADDYQLCHVHACRITQAPSLLAKLRTPTVYFAQEPRRISYEKATSDAYLGAGSGPERWAEIAFRSILKRADRRALAAATAIACNSAFTAESLYRAYARSADVLDLGVDAGVFAPSDCPRERYVLSVGTLDPVKGHATIIEALGLITQSSRPALRIVYERQMAGYDTVLLELAERHRVAVSFHQEIADAELAALYSRAQATVCAARLEPFGLTPLESLSSGTPVVAINEGGFRESVTDGVNGVLVAPSPTGIAEGITAVLEGRVTQDPQQLRATVQARTWDRTVDQLHELFEAVVGSRAS